MMIIENKFRQPLFPKTDSSAFPAKTDYLHTRCNFPISSEPSKLHLRKLLLNKVDFIFDYLFRSSFFVKKQMFSDQRRSHLGSRPGNPDVTSGTMLAVDCENFLKRR
jgi:hypothetical protein